MRRRAFLAFAAGAAISQTRTATGQPSQLPIVGVLEGYAASDREGQARLVALREGLREHGWTDGVNLHIAVRWSANELERAKLQAQQLVALAPKVIVANGQIGVQAARAATASIPIVFVVVAYPVGAGYVASMARPGGNLTGFSSFEPEIGGKWMQLLKDIAPETRRVAGVVQPQFAAFAELWRIAAKAAPGFGLSATTIHFHDAAEIGPAIAEFAREPGGGLIVMPHPAAGARRDSIIAAAARYQLPAIYPFRYYPASGGLMSYGVDTVDLYRRAADYVDRVLKGANPGELPVQAPTKFELVVNLKAASALGLLVPQSLLARADEVIE